MNSTSVPFHLLLPPKKVQEIQHVEQPWLGASPCWFSPTQGMGTVPYYAIIDTGLSYSGVNPATGWTGERCVLLATWARERQDDGGV